MKKYIPKTKDELRELVEDESIYLGDIDTSHIADMSMLFHGGNRKNFDGLEKWDVSNVENMNNMFQTCYDFNIDISSWEVKQIDDMTGMFLNCQSFNQDLSSWKIKEEIKMFDSCPIKESFKPQIG